MDHEIYIIEDDAEVVKMVKELFKGEKGYKFKTVKTANLDEALKRIPELIIINEDQIDIPILDICTQIREDDDNSITPIIVLSSVNGKEHRIEILKQAVEYFIKAPIDEDYLYHTIKNVVRLISTNRTVSPLTALPGNVQIHAELKKRLTSRKDFSVLYFDLDNFKAYNDVYGFLKGDEIIKFTARTIQKHIHSEEFEEEDNCFIGHIGGDDFIGIVNNHNYETICQNIIAEFDKKVLDYFTEEDAEKGYLEVANRKDIIEQFPLTSLSIGVVVVENKRFGNILEIGEIGAQVKHTAKTIMGSSYAIDRRK